MRDLYKKYLQEPALNYLDKITYTLRLNRYDVNTHQNVQSHKRLKETDSDTILGYEDFSDISDINEEDYSYADYTEADYTEKEGFFENVKSDSNNDGIPVYFLSDTDDVDKILKKHNLNFEALKETSDKKYIDHVNAVLQQQKTDMGSQATKLLSNDEDLEPIPDEDLIPINPADDLVYILKPTDTDKDADNYGIIIVQGGKIRELINYYYYGSDPTLSPTQRPTAPTVSPTFIPTKLPTLSPTAEPSFSPTKTPTASPTNTPTAAPSGSPTSTPSASPSTIPSAAPSTSPTRQPSAQPTTIPSAWPSTTPSGQPSSYPSVSPTTVPTSQPSRIPSALPTGQPSGLPTLAPSVKLTNPPTAQPSSFPSISPTAMPSTQPSAKPSGNPSSWPTSAPSGMPSSIPSRQPSAQPSGTPSSWPTSIPSTMPSMIPSRQPSAQPSGNPSGWPTSIPSGAPSGTPTKTPSAMPSTTPSRQPSAQPSGNPSSRPTSIPSAIPSLTPSSWPTTAPSMQPSSQPSRLPTSIPSAAPSTSPSRRPSSIPSGTPTSIPSLSPSVIPTSIPSASPSFQPSFRPSALISPTSMPSTVPTELNNQQSNSSNDVSTLAYAAVGALALCAIAGAGYFGYQYLYGEQNQAKKKTKKKNKVAPVHEGDDIENQTKTIKSPSLGESKHEDEIYVKKDTLNKQTAKIFPIFEDDIANQKNLTSSSITTFGVRGIPDDSRIRGTSDDSTDVLTYGSATSPKGSASDTDSRKERPARLEGEESTSTIASENSGDAKAAPGKKPGSPEENKLSELAETEQYNSQSNAQLTAESIRANIDSIQTLTEWRELRDTSLQSQKDERQQNLSQNYLAESRKSSSAAESMSPEENSQRPDSAYYSDKDRSVKRSNSKSENGSIGSSDSDEDMTQHLKKEQTKQARTTNRFASTNGIESLEDISDADSQEAISEYESEEETGIKTRRDDLIDITKTYLRMIIEQRLSEALKNRKIYPTEVNNIRALLNSNDVGFLFFVETSIDGVIVSPRTYTSFITNYQPINTVLNDTIDSLRIEQKQKEQLLNTANDNPDDFFFQMTMLNKLQQALQGNDKINLETLEKDCLQASERDYEKYERKYHQEFAARKSSTTEQSGIKHSDGGSRISKDSETRNAERASNYDSQRASSLRASQAGSESTTVRKNSGVVGKSTNTSWTDETPTKSSDRWEKQGRRDLPEQDISGGYGGGY